MNFNLCTNHGKNRVVVRGAAKLFVPQFPTVMQNV